MWIDHHALFKPITKATLRLRPGEIVATLAQALKIALSEPQGPVHLDLPEDVALAPATETVRAMPERVPLTPARRHPSRKPANCCALPGDRWP